MMFLFVVFVVYLGWFALRLVAGYACFSLWLVALVSGVSNLLFCLIYGLVFEFLLGYLVC